MNENYQDDHTTDVAVRRFEKMLRENANYFFDLDDLENIVEFYIIENHHHKAMKAISYAKGQYPDSTYFTLRKSQLLSADGQYDTALSLLDEVEIFEPSNPEIFMTRGGIYSMLGKPQEAINAYKAALRLDRGIEELYLFIAFEFQNQNQYGKAARYLKKCLQINPENESALYEMSFCFDAAQKLEAGIVYFNSFLDDHAYSKIAWYALGHLHSKLQNFKKAIEAFDFAIVIDETFAAAWFNKANTLAASERYEEAIVAYKELFKLEEPDAFTFLYIGECYENLDQYPEALKYYEKSAELDEFLPDAWVGIGVVLDFLDRTKESLAYVKKGINLDPTRGTFWFILGDLQLKMGFQAEAEESYQKVIEFEPENDEIWIFLSNLLMQQNRNEEAVAIMHECMKYHTGNARLIFQSCEAELSAGNDRSAYVLAEVAISLDKEMAAKMLLELSRFGMNSVIRGLVERN
jgi:tetratricopeptide (TPR) repeat protein